LAHGYFRALYTIYQKISKLAPAARTLYRGGSQATHARTIPELESELVYFDANKPSGEPNGAAHCTRALVTQAVRRQLVADVPLGCFLSGGTDSSVIAAAMKASAENGQRVMTFAIGFDDPRYDETRYAAEVARHLGTDHHEFRVHPRAAEDLPRLAEVFGEPFADSSAIPTHYLARETRGHVKVALSGDGGDELFGGYGRYRAMRLARRLEGLVPHAASAPLSRLAGGDPKSRATRIGRFFRSLSMPPGKRYSSYMRYFDDATIAQLCGQPWRESNDHVALTVERHVAAGLDVARAARAADRVMYLPDDVLTKVDRAAMLHALEVRSPFMDHELVAFTAGLSTEQLFRGGPKRLLREAFARDLPRFVFKRPKMGFAVPIGQWFRGELRPMLRDHLFASDSFARSRFNLNVVERLVDEHESHRIDHSQRLYALLMLELWWRWHRATVR
jgi:asparagine synthase (glutamine-hydrolysing)